MKRLVLVLALSPILGCSGSSGGKLTCELLSDPANCWAEGAAVLKACLPANPEIGVLAADRQSCSFSNGAVVTFNQALPMSTDDLETFGFTIEAGGSTCGGFLDTFQNRMELTVGGRTIVSQLRGLFELDCGNKSYTCDFDLLFDCPAGTQPTDGFDVSATEVFFSIWSVNTPGELFRCALQ